MSVSFLSFHVKGPDASFPVILSKVFDGSENDDALVDDDVALDRAAVALDNAAVAEPRKPVYEVLLPFNKACKSFGGAINRDSGRKCHNYFKSQPALEAYLKEQSIIEGRTTSRLRVYSFIDFATMFSDKQAILIDMASEIQAYLTANDLTLADEDQTCIADLVAESGRSSPPRKQLAAEPVAATTKRSNRRRRAFNDDEEEEEDANDELKDDEVMPKKKSDRLRRRGANKDDKDDDNKDDDEEEEVMPRKRQRVKADDELIASILEHIPDVLRVAYCKEHEAAWRVAYIKEREAVWRSEVEKDHLAEVNKKLATFLKVHQ